MRPPRLATLLGLAVLAGCEPQEGPTPDRFPGDTEYTERVQAIVAEVAADAVTLARVRRGEPVTRGELCSLLVDRHQEGLSGEQTQTQAEFLACPELDARALRAACVAGLREPDGYGGPEGWSRWAGEHGGTWRDDDGRSFNDSARWADPRTVRSADPEDTADGGGRREYDFQDVFWPGRSVGRHGWNQSHPDVPYVWGWDPKESGNAGGAIGTHVGFTIDRDPCHFILWITAREAFLEGINAETGARTSTGLEGRGQWLVD